MTITVVPLRMLRKIRDVPGKTVLCWRVPPLVLRVRAYKTAWAIASE